MTGTMWAMTPLRSYTLLVLEVEQFINKELTRMEMVKVAMHLANSESLVWPENQWLGMMSAKVEIMTLFVTFSTTGYQNINMYFDILGNEDGGIVSFDLKYDFNVLEDANPADVSGTVKDFNAGSSNDFLNNETLPVSINAIDADFTQISVSFAGLLDNQNLVAIRLDDFKENDAMSIDNVVITGTVIPEPSTYAIVLASLASLVVFFRKK